MQKKFITPSEQDISDYLTTKKNYDTEAARLFAEKFWNYYESCGWKVGKKPMVSWIAAIRTWELNTKNNGTNRTTDNTGNEPKATRFSAYANWINGPTGNSN